MTNTPTLTDFLLARIAEDEQLAQDVVDTHEMWGWDAYVAQAGMYDEAASEFATEHHPARVLAECEAKREALIFAKAVQADMERLAGTTHWTVTVQRTIERNLAKVYADHPDYRDEWRP